ncbi:D-(-)-3-hydroxybutyrate oligomer hydrolase [Thermomonas flagellata]|uniref:D-(-)-3-hydroxybutyrate oligomer hydrolase n=1 Tax=Thermomonas flagellata TaxID=2888524 RepID=UPI001F04F242|nr:D-(-)-3-hydroxybutyrate oligomer hydrolase [Thermomonas flagellata]
MPIASPRPLLAAAALLLAGCAALPAARAPSAQELAMFQPLQASLHRDHDDLLTAGLGLEGLRNPLPPAFADPAHPTAAELRRRAIWSNWRGIADLAPGGGYDEVYGSTAAVPGREFSAYARLPGATQPHRVLVQLPDHFDPRKRCVVVSASSGSRGIYGAIAVAGAWGLPRGCAVAYTDKGAGSDYFDLDAGQGVALDGRVTAAGGDAALAFTPEPAAGHGVAFKHAHSLDNPEADWGRHLKQAAQFALAVLDAQYPQQAPFTFANTRVIAVGISNGGGAVLRAAEDPEPWLDAAVAGEPNVYVDGHGGRALYDYATEAALLMPCALPALGLPPLPGVEARCAALAAAGLLSGTTLLAQQQDALARLRAAGWSDAALRAGATSTGFDLWRAVAVAYASAYGRYPHGAHPCGYRYAALGADLAPRPATAAERAAWWADASGIPPGAGVAIVDPQPPVDLGLTGLRCLRGLWTGEGADARRVRQGIADTRAAPPRAGLPMVVVHGEDDGLIPPAFSSAPYVAMARAAGRDVRHWQVAHVQHFDAFLGLPGLRAFYVPLLPYVYAALDRVDAALDARAPLPADARIAPRPAAVLDAEALAIPR